ncbi:hypothetical protein [Candidatus Odyssella acanthamoebae]|uniref:Uncharacterized protein n=1 Tax=Candidatus Odyssella acanthamoebae TaxID=91604 RepID=A0A077AVJ9_9PROT|nr:hypothetical protein [Candidatus Paracaedibacter acanthamoebae]AIK95683.1 hypothetical protein ID47_01410 [Candidatus Paracaedibacter acanthamoebae]
MSLCLKAKKTSLYWLSIIFIFLVNPITAADNEVTGGEGRFIPPSLSNIKGEEEVELNKERGEESQNTSSSSPTDRGLDSEEEEIKPAHFFSLTEDDKNCHSYLDSRAIWNDKNLSFHNHEFKDWHKSACQHLKDLTPQVRKFLAFNDRPSSTNLLRYRVDIISTTSNLDIEIENDQSVWVSGWPSEPVKNNLPAAFHKEKFRFIDDLLPPEERKLARERKRPFLIQRITAGYKFETYSYLIKERQDYVQKSLNKAKINDTHFNMRFLHTEQGLLTYLSSEEFITKAIKKIKEITQDKDYQKEELAIVINIASSNSVCLCCADRIFRESEWGNRLLHTLQSSLKTKLKLHFLASAIKSYTDDLVASVPESEELIERLKKDKTARARIGFDGESKISFMGGIEGRQTFDSELPLLAHTLIKGE